MTSAFAGRLGRAKEWADQVHAKFKQDGWQTVPLGAENVAPEVQEALSKMRNPDATARFVRYMPDGFAVRVEEETACFFDAKRSRAIEKDAYLAYQAFAGQDRNVYVFIRNNGDTYCVPIRDLCFLDSRAEVGQYPPERQMPIDDEGWIAPRLWPERHYRQWKRNHPQASGTAFKYFDFGKMERYWLTWAEAHRQATGGPLMANIPAATGGRCANGQTDTAASGIQRASHPQAHE